MRVSRRRFMQGAGAAGLAVFASSRAWAVASASQPIVMEAKPGSAQLLEAPAGPTAIWGYGGRVPGPILRAKRGDEIWVRLKNSLPQPTTIHWHGIRIDNAMDGVAHLTQEPVAAGETFDYRFTVPDAGSFWYHPHHLSWEQVARGLYGALVVEESDPFDVDQDIAFIVDDWRLDESGHIHEASFGDMHDVAHAGRLGNVVTVNGQPMADIAVKPGERIRLRLMNTCNARVLELQFEDVESHIVAQDGQPTPPRSVDDGRLILAPAQRVDLVVDMSDRPGARTAITEISQDRLVIGRFVHSETGKGARRKTSPQALTDNALTTPDLADVQKVELLMQGGAMGMMRGAMFRGMHHGMGELVRDYGQVWSLNGTAGMPEKPLFSVPRGRSVEIRMINETSWPHAMHMHGHHFREVRENASAVPAWQDTALLLPEETRSYAFVADNPGKWMIHCHMLEHQAGGMGTWFEVT